MSVLLELQQEAMFFFSALLTRESFGEGEKEKHISSPTYCLICLTTLRACHLCLISPDVEESLGEKNGVMLVLVVECSVFSLFSSSPASSLSPFGKALRAWNLRADTENDIQLEPCSDT